MGRGLQGARASVAAGPGHQGTGSVVGVHGLRCSVKCEVFQALGLNVCLLHWQADRIEPPGKSPLSAHFEAVEYSTSHALTWLMDHASVLKPNES